MSIDLGSALNLYRVEDGIASVDDVVSAAQAGSPSAFTQLHAFYSKRLYRTILAITKNHEDAEDALQETFLRTYLTIHTFERRSSVYSWLTRIAINSALMILRKRRVRPEELFDLQREDELDSCRIGLKDSAPNPEEQADAQQRRLRLLRAMHALKPHLSAPLRMQTLRGRSIREIGQALNLSVAAVKARLHRARRRLAAMDIDKKRARVSRIHALEDCKWQPTGLQR